MILTYAASQGISERSAWRALRAAVQRGWIRKTQGAAPGIPARYQLQVPVDLVVNDLPEDLARALRLWDEDAMPEPDHADTYVGHLAQAPITPVTLTPPTDPFPGENDEPQDQETEPEPSADQADSTQCQTSPLYARAGYPLWVGTCTTPGATCEPEPDPVWEPSRRRRPLGPGELEAGRQVLARCVPWWQRQRGPWGVLSAAEAEALVGPAAYALRRTTPSELVEELTVQCASARSLPHLVGWRLWRIIRSRTEYDQVRPADLPAEPDICGPRWRRMVAESAHYQAEVNARTAALRADLRARVQQVADEQAVAHQPPGWAPPTWLRESESVHLIEQAWETFEQTGPPLQVYRARAHRPAATHRVAGWRTSPLAPGYADASK